MSTYQLHPRATLGRYKARAKYDYQTIHSIIDACPMLHVSFVPSPDDPFPTTLPLLGSLGSFNSQDSDFSSGPLDIYIHTHAQTRLVKLAEVAGNNGHPVCVAATLLDGFVLALTPFNHSCNYRSAVIHGYATIVNEEAERMYAMEIITNGAIPNRWVNSRVPPTRVELQSTGILKIRIESASAKIRAAGVSDDRKDLKDESIVNKVWAGVVPCWTQLGAPVPSEYNKAELPKYIEDWRKDMNEGGENYANAAAKKKK